MDTRMNNEIKDSVNAQALASAILPYLYVLIIASWAGIVRYLNYVKGHSTKLSIFILMVEIMTSGFVGVCTYWLCLYIGVSEPLMMFLVAIAGHLGAKAIKVFEQGWMRFFEKTNKGLSNDSDSKNDGADVESKSTDS
jgi:TctA family transporter